MQSTRVCIRDTEKGMISVNCISSDLASCALRKYLPGYITLDNVMVSVQLPCVSNFHAPCTISTFAHLNLSSIFGTLNPGSYGE